MKSLLISHYNKLEIRFNIVRVRRNNLTIVRKTSALKKYTVLLTVKYLSFQHYNDVTWTLLCLKCPTTPWFVQYSIQAHNKETPKPALRALCEGNPSVTDGFPHKGLIMWKAFHAVILYIEKCSFAIRISILQTVVTFGVVGFNINDLHACVSFNKGPTTTVHHSYYAHHYNDVIMSAVAPQITGVSIVYSTVCSGADQRKHHSPTSLAFVGEFTGQRASNAENISIWWRYHVIWALICLLWY